MLLLLALVAAIGTGSVAAQEPVDSTEQFGRVPSKDLEPWLEVPMGIWGTVDGDGDGDVLWLIGYNLLLSEGGWLYDGHLESRDLTAGDDFDTRLSASATNAGGIQSSGLWSDGTTMWVLRDVVEPETDIPISGGNKIRAYTLSGFNRDSAKDITVAGANTKPSGLWSDGTTLYTADSGQKKVFAYTLSSGARDSAKEFNLFDGGDSLLSDGNSLPAGLWSDGTTMWVTDGDRRVYAYTLATGAYDSDKSFSASVNVVARRDMDLLVPTTNTPHGIWSDGTTIWITDVTAGGVHAFNLTGTTPVGGV